MTVAGVAHPVGLRGIAISSGIPLRIKPASRPGVMRVASGLNPAAETPGMVESIVLAITIPAIGLSNSISGLYDTNGIE